MKLKYKRAIIKVNGERPHYCNICGRAGKPRGMQFHHFKYAYMVSEVRKNPILAVENTIFICFRCHQVANAFRICQENKEVVEKLKDLYGKIGAMNV